MSRSFTGFRGGANILMSMMCGLLTGGMAIHAQTTEEGVRSLPDTVHRTSIPIDTIRTYSDESIAGFYTSTAIRRHIQRYRLPAGTLVHGVLVELDGSTADTAGTVTVYGHEGGYTVPHFRKPLIAPATFAKTQAGRQTVRIDFPSPLDVNEGQIFISVERLTGDIRPLTDQVKRPPYCTEANGIERFDQILGHDDGRWETGPYAFRYTLLCDLPDVRMPMFSRDTTVDDGHGVATLATKYISCADVNGDGLDDVVFGGSVGSHTQVYIQTKPGTFARAASIDSTGGTSSEDQAIVLVDIDGDGDRDLIVGAGGVEFEHDDNEMLSYVYINDGKGKFTRDQTGRLPDIRTTAATIVAGDYDHDGAVDLFIGGGVGAQYPLPSRSFILRNDGKGRFKDVTNDVAPGLSSIGMVRGALWSDVDNDGRLDLFVVGEWMPITLFHNEGNGRFVNITAQAGMDSTVGWWYSINGADVDNDGDMDYVLGNIGLNNRYQASAERPIEIWAADFDDNGSIDPLITYYPFQDEHKPYLMRDRGKIFSQMPTLNRKFNHYSEFASAPLDKVIDREALDTAWHRAATLMKSIVLLNNGNKTFTIKPLPDIAQISPLLGTEFLDLDGDDNIDLVTVGNMYGAEDDVVRYDAGKGLVLMGDGNGEFRPLSIPEAGFVSPFDTRGVVLAKNVGASDVPLVLITAVNQGRAESFKLNDADGVRVMALDPARVTHAITVFEDGRRRKTEAYCGSGYRTQSSCNLVVSSRASRVHLYNQDRLVEDKDVTKAK